MLETAILIVMVIVGLAIVGLILVQQGKGAEMGASFGSGASNTVFGSQGSGNFLTHTTGILAAVFFACCLALAWYGNNKSDRVSGIDFSASEVQLKEIPAAPDVPTVTPTQPASGDVPAAPAASGAAVEVTVPAAAGSATAPAVDAAGTPASAAPEGAQSAPATAPAAEQKSQ